MCSIMLKTVWANTHMATQAQLPKNLRSRLRMELPEAPTNMVGFFYEFEMTNLTQIVSPWVNF